jgi:putative nucleotidyltransferase with HDIG domain
MEWVDWVGGGNFQMSRDVVPMVPAVAREVLDFATDPDVPAKRITNVVSRDPVLTTRVLQLANSAASASAVQITSVENAVVRMGTNSVRNVVTAVCVASILADKGAYGTGGRDLMDHGVGTAYLAWLLADATGGARDEAFVCGLLHDIGKLLIQQLAHRPPAGMKKPSASEVSLVMQDQHAEVGGQLLRAWQLPQALHDAATFHHDPARAAGSPAATVAYAANRLAHRYGFGCTVEEFEPLTDPVFPTLGIDDASLARIEKQARKMFEVARQLSA